MPLRRPEDKNMRINKKFKKGAASFYIVAFSTLILLIVATSFAAVIISEITRTSNDDLSQSAYDSALAGVEDAKLAYYNYQNCVKDNIAASSTAPTNLDCSAIVYYMENPLGQDCDMVGRILGRVGTNEEGKEVVVSETSVGNNMQQAYTCVKVQTILKDYRSTLSSSAQIKVVKVKFDEPVHAKDIKHVKLSWYETADESTYHWTNLPESGTNSGKVVFPQVGVSQAATPPTISLALVQTADSFTINDFDKTIDNTTDRGMLYLVPTKNATFASRNVSNNYNGSWNGSQNKIGADAFSKSNDKRAMNVPYAVYCNPASTAEFACSVIVDLPEPVNGARNDETFMFVVGLPYGKPNTDFSMEFFCDGLCATDKVVTVNDEGETVVVEEKTDQASLDGVQVKVDSTGRANDLYRRVETRLESEANSSYLSIMGPLELLGDNGSSELLKKTEAVKSEWNFN